MSRSWYFPLVVLALVFGILLLVKTALPPFFEAARRYRARRGARR